MRPHSVEGSTRRFSWRLKCRLEMSYSGRLFQCSPRSTGNQVYRGKRLRWYLIPPGAIHLSPVQQFFTGAGTKTDCSGGVAKCENSNQRTDHGVAGDRPSLVPAVITCKHDTKQKTNRSQSQAKIRNCQCIKQHNQVSSDGVRVHQVEPKQYKTNTMQCTDKQLNYSTSLLAMSATQLFFPGT